MRRESWRAWRLAKLQEKYINHDFVLDRRARKILEEQIDDVLKEIDLRADHPFLDIVSIVRCQGRGGLLLRRQEIESCDE